MSGLIVVQQISVRWRKTARGGVSAARRNAVPEALPLPLRRESLTPDTWLNHAARFGEANDFAAPQHESLTEEPLGTLQLGCVTITPQADAVMVAYEYSFKCAGMPRREPFPGTGAKNDFTLRLGQWGRVRYNGRFAEDEWRYEKVVINVGFFERLLPDAFLASSPTHEISRLASLK
ncbi:MAG TPA: hypothetical protein VKA60_18570 [Blastocatellia bacterium]|nr:hypothetical protein [Blastocatellia bacterium]